MNIKELTKSIKPIIDKSNDKVLIYKVKNHWNYEIINKENNFDGNNNSDSIIISGEDNYFLKSNTIQELEQNIKYCYEEVYDGMKLYSCFIDQQQQQKIDSISRYKSKGRTIIEFNSAFTDKELLKLFFINAIEESNYKNKNKIVKAIKKRITYIEDTTFNNAFKAKVCVS